VRGKRAEGASARQALCRDARTVPAGGAVEMELSRRLGELARQEAGLEQYAIAKFAAALEARALPPGPAAPRLPARGLACSRPPLPGRGRALHALVPWGLCSASVLPLPSPYPPACLHKLLSHVPCAAPHQVVPRTIAENSGLDATAVVAALAGAHAAGQAGAGLDVETGEPADLSEQGIVDLFATKWWALKLAAEAVCTVLRVDQIIMAKQAGGPKPRADGAMDED